MRYEARAPLRIDFAGGWTDDVLFAQEEGGAVTSAAINQYAHGYTSWPVRGGPIAVLRSDRSYLSYSTDLPLDAGLGALGAQIVLWATLTKVPIANTSSRTEIAEMACGIAQTLNILDGRQDQYTSAIGGIVHITFSDTVQAERLEFDPAFLDTLRSRLVLAYGGPHGTSAGLAESVWSRYLSGDKHVTDALRHMRTIGNAVPDALHAHDIEGLAALIGDNWKQQKVLYPSTIRAYADGVIEFAERNGALAGKCCGREPAGALLFVAAAGSVPQLRTALKSRGIHTIDFDIDTYGVHLKKA
ncbi:MAG: GHMP kinase [Chloroflexota bacterium]